ncbi:MAG TPA: ROK family protein [Fimbriimonadaceae bacterium]|nr:ROK family protein [Fimbriimonadaceae bacterium]
MGPCVIGVDLGGTNVRACAYYEDGTPAGERADNPSKGQSGTEAILGAIAQTVRQAADSAASKPEAVGIAVPGHIDGQRGVVVWAPNFGETRGGVFYNWENVAIGEPLSKATGLPFYCGNDANLAALGEYRFGSGRNEANCLVLLTIGTGIGGGVILRPVALQGDVRGPAMLLGGNQGGAELGHMILMHGGLDCNAGSYGAMEGYCQRDSIVRRAVHRLNRGRESLLRDMVDGDFSKVTPQLISQAAEKGDEMAIEVWREVGTWLGVGIGSLINIFAPDVFAIGGQIARAGDFLLEPARKTARNIAIPSLFKDAKIVQAEQISDAGILGGAALALEAMKWKKA